jgi:hypothetical protein
VNLTAIQPCPRCGDELTAENFVGAWDVLGAPLIHVAIECPCGMEGTMNMPADRFHELHAELGRHYARLREQAERMDHRVRSEIGREVAKFRTILREVATVADLERMMQ